MMNHVNKCSHFSIRERLEITMKLDLSLANSIASHPASTPAGGRDIRQFAVSEKEFLKSVIIELEVFTFYFIGTNT
jgi:hypothetical protein